MILNPTVKVAGCGGLLLAGLGLLSLFIGSGQVPLNEVWAVLTGTAPSQAEHAIVWKLRLNRIPVAVVAGAALGVAGALTQTLTRNPLAEPGLLGVNSGAALGVAIGYTLLASPATGVVVAFALIGAALTGGLVLIVGGVITGKRDTLRLILSGAALSAVASSGTHWLVVTNPAAFQSFRGWASGTVNLRPLPLVVVCAVLAGVAVLLVLALSRDLNALALGNDMAMSLGARPRLTWAVSGGAAVVLSGCATVLVGPIGFLGLMAPLLVRALAGPKVVPLVLGSAMFGAATLLLADVVGRVIIPPREVAAGIICALIGGPLFVTVARRMRVVRL
ncbi:MAG: iron ABC transporter permease [Propionibacteriaceae bacterium]|nr:iron ABC transporter permease [Propionibacteriaceae bacterium]